MQRQVVMAVGLVTVVGALPAAALAQRQIGPGPDTPRLLVGTLHGSDRQLGVDAADALRTRIQDESSVRDLYVIPRKDINSYLSSSGYQPDSALSPTDMKELAKLLRADMILDGDVNKAPKGVHVEARLMLSRDISLAQPLPPVDGRDVGDAAAQLERELSAARRQLDGNKKCEDALRNRKPQEAIKAALDAIHEYPNATLARLCLASAYADSTLGFPPDSVLRVTNEIATIDPKNAFALRIAYGAYQKKGDDANSVQTLLKLYKLQPTDQSLVTSIIDILGRSDPAKALPIVDDVLQQNPGDPTILHQKWLLQLRVSDFKGAMSTGEQMVRADTALADSTYYTRMIAAATSDSNNAKAAEYAALAQKKFPKNPDYPFLQGVALRGAGQYPAAAQAFHRALDIDPKNTRAQLFLAQTYSDMNQPDSMAALANSALAAGGDKSVWGPMLLGPAKNAFDHANQTKDPNDWQQALTLAQRADSVSASAAGKFFIGVASFQIAIDALQKAGPSKSCDLSKKAQDMFTLSQLNMPAGGSIDAGTAQNILGYVQKYSPVADQMVKAYCKK
ncbi:MAG TPA: tetratricopeptide repeat protein [Gemmatimonadaceae bacterium]|nr:tetratricopeptide repeat protein [Gemmatimonadaceae bacterium]